MSLLQAFGITKLGGKRMSPVSKMDCANWERGIHTGCRIGRKICTASRSSNQCTGFKLFIKKSDQKDGDKQI
jgi:hypothetical protein